MDTDTSKEIIRCENCSHGRWSTETECKGCNFTKAKVYVSQIAHDISPELRARLVEKYEKIIGPEIQLVLDLTLANYGPAYIRGQLQTWAHTTVALRNLKKDILAHSC